MLRSEHQNRVSIRCIASVQINSTSDLSIDRFAETSNCDPFNDGRRIASQSVRQYQPADARCCEGNETKKCHQWNYKCPYFWFGNSKNVRIEIIAPILLLCVLWKKNIYFWETKKSELVKKKFKNQLPCPLANTDPRNCANIYVQPIIQLAY